MSRGAILFAFNNPKYNYYDMAKITARRINHFLGLPVTLVTDQHSFPQDETYIWDKVIKVIPDKNNSKDRHIWINKGRYQAFELSPYEETILLDADYIVNSNKLLKTFETYDDFCCHANAHFLMYPAEEPELLSAHSYQTLWATVVTFRKTKRAKQIFDCLEMVQKNYDHYANLYGFLNSGYRNDYGVTIALRIVNGHSMISPRDIIPWDLVHVGKYTQVFANNTGQFNTEFTVMTDTQYRNKTRKEYITVKDMDFHMFDKDIFMSITSNE